MIVTRTSILVFTICLIIGNLPALAGGWDPIGDLKNPSRILKNIQRETGNVGRALDRGRIELQSQAAAPALQVWIRESRNSAVRAGVKPIPPHIRQALSIYFSDGLLDRVRYRVGSRGVFDLPQFAFGLQHRSAIVLEDVVVFRNERDVQDVQLWAHEVAHVDQYERWGLRKFAIRYLRSWNSVENEAIRVERAFSERYARLSPKQRGDYGRIKLENSCWKPIRAAIRYKNLDGEWDTEGWWKIEPGGRSYVADTRNRVAYLYAESTRGELYWLGDERRPGVDGDGHGLEMRRVRFTEDGWGDWTYEFHCDNAADHFLYFENDCPGEMWLAVRYKSTDGDWKTRGWYRLDAGEEVYVAQTNNRILYFYAESGHSKWSGDERYYQVRDNDSQEYGFMRWAIDKERSGNNEFLLKCS